MSHKSLTRTVAEAVADYLKKECGYGWVIHIEGDTLTGTYWDDEYFSLEHDVSKWYLNCKSMPLDITHKLYEIIVDTEKQWNADRDKRKTMNQHDCIHEIMQQLDYDPVKEALDTPPDELTIPTPEDFDY